MRRPPFFSSLLSKDALIRFSPRATDARISFFFFRVAHHVKRIGASLGSQKFKRRICVLFLFFPPGADRRKGEASFPSSLHSPHVWLSRRVPSLFSFSFPVSSRRASKKNNDETFFFRPLSRSLSFPLFFLSFLLGEGEWFPVRRKCSQSRSR